MCSTVGSLRQSLSEFNYAANYKFDRSSLPFSKCIQSVQMKRGISGKNSSDQAFQTTSGWSHYVPINGISHLANLGADVEE